ncbi:MAG: hypothetical protein IKM87_07000 [Clostridia bacterium]|nr:hypothetical protein [Clostridia bacterium]
MNNESNNNEEKKGLSLGSLIIFGIILVFLLSMCSGPSNSSGTPKKGYHYEKRLCSHCKGAGKTDYGATCLWCDGYGYYTIQVKD